MTLRYFNKLHPPLIYFPSRRYMARSAIQQWRLEQSEQQSKDLSSFRAKWMLSQHNLRVDCDWTITILQFVIYESLTFPTKLLLKAINASRSATTQFRPVLADFSNAFFQDAITFRRCLGFEEIINRSYTLLNSRVLYNQIYNFIHQFSLIICNM